MLKMEKMTLEHLDEVMIIEEQNFVIPWSKQAMQDEINKGYMAIYYVAILDDKIVGYGGMWHVVTEGHITNIAISDEYKHRGIGSALVNKLLDVANEKDMIGVTLEVRVSNKAAIGLYKKYGFVLSGVRKEYYEDNREDAYIMWKYLIPIEQIENL